MSVHWSIYWPFKHFLWTLLQGEYLLSSTNFTPTWDCTGPLSMAEDNSDSWSVHNLVNLSSREIRLAQSDRTLAWCSSLMAPVTSCVFKFLGFYESRQTTYKWTSFKTYFSCNLVGGCVEGWMAGFVVACPVKMELRLNSASVETGSWLSLAKNKSAKRKKGAVSYSLKITPPGVK